MTHGFWKTGTLDCLFEERRVHAKCGRTTSSSVQTDEEQTINTQRILSRFSCNVDKNTLKGSDPKSSQDIYLRAICLIGILLGF
jgi:hypothetical protein